MAERKNAKAMAGGSLQDRSHTGLDVPLQGNTSHALLDVQDLRCAHALTRLLVNVTDLLSSLAEFPTPKTELVQKFQVLYVGMMPVDRPIGKTARDHKAAQAVFRPLSVAVIKCRVFSGMDVLNSAVDSLMTSSARDDWTPVMLNVADATVTVIKEKANNGEKNAKHIPSLCTVPR